ncbi:MAG: ABC transporter substrate-binding protein [Trebonia sp.]|uniref:ABC transporter substrate-binding protein n=1 Tax=Trebonia sp. TaxID=2767075 RepID=UPI003C739155
MRRTIRAGAVLAAGLLAAALAACGGSSPSSGSGSASGPSGTLTISNEQGTLWTCSFNPFNPSNLAQGVTFGQVYEPLAFVNTLQSGKATPWLATAWAWSNGNKMLTFTIRNGVKWNDGTPMTAADVAFTFNLMKKFPTLDLNSVWSVLSSVTQQGNKVVMTFKNAAVPYFYYIADQTPIVPQHVWSTIANPVSYADANPVGTGAFTVNPCSAQNITYVANPHYWQPGEPKLAKVLYPAFTSNDPANTYLATGQAQWGSQFIPNIESFYTSKSPDNHYWFPPIANVTLIPNLTVPGLNNAAVRQAMAYAIDRNRVSQIGEYGYEPPANQTGIVTPTFSSWEDTSAASQYDYTYNPAKAKQILTSAGFKMGSNGIFASPSGKALSFTVINIGGYSDWVASMQVIQQDLKTVGIQITTDNLSQNDFLSRLYNGDYQLAYNNQQGGPSPYYEFRQWLYSANSAPIGKQAASNWERYSNPATDALINQYATTTSKAQQQQIVDQLQQVLLKDVPFIPVTEEVAWYQYNTAKFTGWVTQSDPYAVPAAYFYPDMGQVLLHLAPAK